MNNKIKELAEQADCSIDGMGYGEGDIEAFAELIVRECIEACNENNKQVHAHLGISVCVKSIRQRFGITE